MKTIRRKLFVFLLFLCTGNALRAQYEACQWQFAFSCGLDFMSDPPLLLITGSQTAGFPASIADENGNLLFYTNGITVWDKNHAVMANGTGLSGPSFGPGAWPLIIKQPGTAALYYIFALNALQGGLSYSIVDMGLSSGTGSVIVKNVIAANYNPLNIMGIRHCNGKDVWLIFKENSTNCIYSYLFTSFGLNPNPVITQFPSWIKTSWLRTNTNGNKIAVSYQSTLTLEYVFEVYDFDRSGGGLSNALTLGSFTNTSKSFEFSPDGSKLHALLGTILVQWDLCGNPSQVIASLDTVAVASSTLTSAQLAPNGKIYMRSGFNEIAVIHSPNLAGSLCNFADSVILSPNIISSFPAFVTDLLRPRFQYNADSACARATFSAPVLSGCTAAASTYTWDFADPLSGPANTSTLANPTHLFSGGGNYKVKVMVGNGPCVPDTIKGLVSIPFSPTIALSGKFNICKDESTVITASGADTFTWSTGAISESVVVTPAKSTIYTVTGTYTNNNCPVSRTLNVNVSPCTDLHSGKEEAPDIKVYPNPTSGHFVITSTVYPIKIRMYNTLGRLVFEAETESGECQGRIANLADGLYLIRVCSANKEGTLKLVKFSAALLQPD